MKKIIILVAISLIVSSCAQPTPSENQIQTAIAKTNSSIPTAEATSTPVDTDTPIPSQTSTKTPAPTNTPTKTAIPKPSATINATATIEAARQELVDLTVNFLEHGEGLEDIKQVNLVRLNDDGVFEIEVKSIWASKDRQPDLSYLIISYLAKVLNSFDERAMFILNGGKEFKIHLTTYSTDGGYRYQSTTTFSILKKVASKSISYEEWVTESGAGFK